MVEGDCIVCGCRRARPFLAEPPHLIVECLACGHLYTFPPPDQAAVDEHYASFGGWIAEDERRASGTDPRYSFCVALLQRRHPPPAIVLDVGCSAGRFLRMAAAAGYDCYGVEPGADAERAARVLGADRVFRRLYTAPTGPRCDIITFFEVLEHMPDPRIALRAAAQQLAPGGHLLASLPGQRFSRWKVWPRRRLGIRALLVPLVLGAGNHLHHFSVAGLRRTLHDVGLTVVASGALPPDYNYLANRRSAALKRAWSALAGLGAVLGGEPWSSNIWVLASKPGV